MEYIQAKNFYKMLIFNLCFLVKMKSHTYSTGQVGTRNIKIMEKQKDTK